MNLQLERDAFGALVMIDANSRERAVVTAVRAFPLSAPEAGSISLVGADGHERGWIDRLDELQLASRALIREELAARDLALQVLRAHSIRRWPVNRHVEAKRNETGFELKVEFEKDIRASRAARLR